MLHQFHIYLLWFRFKLVWGLLIRSGPFSFVYVVNVFTDCHKLRLSGWRVIPHFLLYLISLIFHSLMQLELRWNRIYPNWHLLTTIFSNNPNDGTHQKVPDDVKNPKRTTNKIWGLTFCAGGSQKVIHLRFQRAMTVRDMILCTFTAPVPFLYHVIVYHTCTMCPLEFAFASSAILLCSKAPSNSARSCTLEQFCLGRDWCIPREKDPAVAYLSRLTRHLTETTNNCIRTYLQGWGGGVGWSVSVLSEWNVLCWWSALFPVVTISNDLPCWLLVGDWQDILPRR